MKLPVIQILVKPSGGAQSETSCSLGKQTGEAPRQPRAFLQLLGRHLAMPTKTISTESKSSPVTGSVAVARSI